MGPWWLTVGTIQDQMRLLREEGARLESGPLTATVAGARAREAVLEAMGALARTQPLEGDHPVGPAWTAVTRAQAAVEEANALAARRTGHYLGPR
jgi:hypothetical protein